ncbi:MAG: glycerophosphodiester phosphodiesterase [Bdellovibrionales bacterium]|jgi:glycerophosphoryl diester phosphodiesterase|nr:glycerophosphodiester phosphodiesterase [Bdellovibrionales bacterium]
MKLFDRLENRTEELAFGIAMGAADWTLSKLPGTFPPRPSHLPPARIIAHRGAWRVRGCAENTFSAFDRAREAGCWGIEFDVRLTKDGVPVVHHDETLLRTFGRPLAISDLTLSTLHHEAKDVPTLESVIAEYGPSLHLMIELKPNGVDWTKERLLHVRELLKKRTPETDFHIMSLDTELLESFSRVTQTSRKALVAVTTTDIQSTSDIAYHRGYKGFCSHWLLMTEAMIDRHHSIQQSCGVGFAASYKSLMREWSRGIDWVFTNHGHEAPEWLSQIESKPR